MSLKKVAYLKLKKYLQNLTYKSFYNKKYRGRPYLKLEYIGVEYNF